MSRIIINIINYFTNKFASGKHIFSPNFLNFKNESENFVHEKY